MDTEFLNAITKILHDFVQTKFSSNVLEVSGPIKESLSYRWRFISTRYKEITVLLVTKKHFMGKPTAERFEIYGFEATKQLGPNLEELQAFLASSNLELAG
jgi:hypothetical protein